MSGEHAVEGGSTLRSEGPIAIIITPLSPWSLIEIPCFDELPVGCAESPLISAAALVPAAGEHSDFQIRFLQAQQRAALMNCGETS